LNFQALPSALCSLPTQGSQLGQQRPQSFMLELCEAVIGEAGQIRHLGYRYHFQDKQNNLVFRYDNTPHFQNLENFPHHKHLADKVTGVEQPSILKVIEEAWLLAQ